MKIVSETVQSETGQVFFRTTVASDMSVDISGIKGKATTRTLPVDEYGELLSLSMRVDKNPYFHVPKEFYPGADGYIDGYIGEDGWIAVWRVKGIKRLLVHSSGHYMVPFPDLIFLVKAGKNNVEGYVWAIDDKDWVYRYPFGNVSTTGAICMGNINLSDVPGAEAFTEEFFLGKTNNDYFGIGTHIKPKYSQQELLRRLEKKDRFPKRWLVDSKMTLEDIIRRAKPSNFEEMAF